MGYLSPQALSFLLAVQALARRLDRRTLSRLRASLETNQRAYFDAASRTLDRAVLATRLRLPDEVPAPAPPGPLPLLPADEGDADEAAAPEEEVAAPPRQNEGRPVFRVGEARRQHNVRVGIVGGVLAVVLVLACMDEGPIRVTQAVLGGMMGFLLIGRLAGPMHRWHRCSDPTCEAVIPEGEEQCPRCGGQVCGIIDRRGDRLAAEEALEEEVVATADPEEAGTGEEPAAPSPAAQGDPADAGTWAVKLPGWSKRS